MNVLLKFIVGGLSRMSWSGLYALSSAVCFVLRRVVRYRKGVITENLEACFPNKTAKEIGDIRDDFYQNFVDYVFETIKLAHITDAEIRERMIFSGLEIMEKALADGKNIVVFFSHCFNWEWAPSVVLHLPRTAGGKEVEYSQVYRPLKNTSSDAMMLRLRGRFGSRSYKKNNVLRDLVRVGREGKLWVCGFMSDQRPSHGDEAIPVRFLGRQTAFISGTERLAKSLGATAIYWDMEKLSRGKYHVACRLLTEDASNCERGALTEKYARFLEETIRRRPGLWLWSHKRWKVYK